MTLDLIKPVREQLEKLRKTTNADSLVEVIRRSLAVYEHLWKEKNKGNKIVVKDKTEGKEKELILI